MRLSRRLAILSGLSAVVAGPATASSQGDPLPSWNPGPVKQSIIDFVAKVTRPGPDFVPPPERIAVFDNDGTLWVEQPLYTQVAFALDRAGEMAAKNPALREKPAFRAAADKDLAALAKLDEKALIELSLATETGLTPEAYRALAATWLARTHHPKLATPYQRLVYQPQLELLAYLRAHGFRTYIVSGGDVEFMRAFAENTYGVPPEQVIGSSQKAAYALTEGRAEVTFRPELGSLDDGPGKPVNIALHIGRRPVIAVGNSDGDLAMLQYVAGRAGPSLAVLVHHDDDTREYAYDRASHIGRLDKALDEARERKWTIVSMKSDWRTVFPRP